jgi:hypothetical protein
MHGFESVIPGALLPVVQAAANKKEEAAVSGALWISGMIVAVVLAGVLLLMLRRRLFSSPPSSGAALHDVLGLDDITRLRDSGEITIQEYETLRARAIAALKGESGAAGPEKDRSGEPSAPSS